MEEKNNKDTKIVRYFDILPINEYVAVKQILLYEPGYQIQWSDNESKYFALYKDLGREHLEWIWPFINQFYGDYAVNNNFKFEQIKLEKLYVNCHPSHHQEHWHNDGNIGFIIFYYPDLNIDYGTEAGLDIEGHGIEPYIANSLLIIPSNIQHRINMHTQTGKFRFNIAVQFSVILPIPERE